MRVVSWLVAVVVGAIALLFALDNRQSVVLGFWPFPIEVHVPLFVAILGGGFGGFLVGGTVAWLAGGRWRRLARRRGREIEALNRRVRTLEEQAGASGDPPPAAKPGPVLRLAAMRGA